MVKAIGQPVAGLLTFVKSMIGQSRSVKEA